MLETQQRKWREDTIKPAQHRVEFRCFMMKVERMSINDPSRLRQSAKRVWLSFWKESSTIKTATFLRERERWFLIAMNDSDTIIHIIHVTCLKNNVAILAGFLSPCFQLICSFERKCLEIIIYKLLLRILICTYPHEEYREILCQISF